MSILPVHIHCYSTYLACDNCEDDFLIILRPHCLGTNTSICSSFVKFRWYNGDTEGNVTVQHWTKTLPKEKKRFALTIEGPTRIYDIADEDIVRLPDYQTSFNIPAEGGEGQKIEMPRDNCIVKLCIHVEAELECGIMFTYIISTVVLDDDSGEVEEKAAERG
ncbi:hypothetical protein PILCRDRAFT_772 [Piloderma croceum F 1598]|uniref:Uncharacterized protein n=1 Tax=Piloderma croceum (strain F 1598) TaxID=765440 RepID=A0A0C3GJ26_PILCF|nr:hypothetical protein PILCRDRAFT_772 [Piloderma croceum F 1598]